MVVRQQQDCLFFRLGQRYVDPPRTIRPADDGDVELVERSALECLDYRGGFETAATEPWLAEASAVVLPASPRLAAGEVHSSAEDALLLESTWLLELELATSGAAGALVAAIIAASAAPAATGTADSLDSPRSCRSGNAPSDSHSFSSVDGVDSFKSFDVSSPEQGADFMSACGSMSSLSLGTDEPGEPSGDPVALSEWRDLDLLTKHEEMHPDRLLARAQIVLHRFAPPQGLEEPPAATMPDDPDFSGFWVLESTSGGMDRFLIECGLSLSMCESAKFSRYGVGRVCCDIRHWSDRIEFDTIGIKGPRSQKFVVDGMPHRTTQVNGNSLTITSNWSDGARVLEQRGLKEDGTKALCSSLSLDGESMAVEMTAPSGSRTLVRTSFRRRMK